LGLSDSIFWGSPSYEKWVFGRLSAVSLMVIQRGAEGRTLKACLKNRRGMWLQSLTRILVNLKFQPFSKITHLPKKIYFKKNEIFK
jgi:hypothetical protein